MDIQVEGVGVVRGGREVLTIPKLDVGAGRSTAILGPNGAGKTTLLRLIAGLERPDRGRVRVGGHIADTRRRSVAYVLQEDVFLRGSLLHNLALALDIHGVPRSQARERAMSSLRLLGIDDLATRRADRISGGEARRASLARALCLGAPVLLLDEPMAGLDRGTYARLLAELPEVVCASGATTVLVTHDRMEAFRFCDDLVVMLGGHVIAAGAKGEIARNPRRADVAGVLGYSVLVVDGRQVAIPHGALHLAEGAGEFTGIVEAVVDVVHEWDVIAKVGEARVHIAMPRSGQPPMRGDGIQLRAREKYDLS